MADPTQDTVDTNQPSYLEMSDEDILKMPMPSFEPSVGETVDAPATESVQADAGTESPQADPADDEDTGADEDAGAADAAPAESASQADEEGDEAGSEAADKEVDKPEAKPVAAEASVDAEKATTDKAIDYEAEYKKLTAPFKANGKDIQVASVDDAIQLMQMGANYNKKMAALKPNLKLLKMLENNNLLSEEKLSFLIDLDKKNPGAINKLVKDSGIDPMELDAEKASAYKQTAYGVDDREFELDTVLEEIKESPAYTRTLEVVGNRWDSASKQVIAQAPQLLKVINDHVASGIYDLISTEIERERMFGRLKGVSDLEAYRQVGDSIQARGGFNHLFQNQQGSGNGALNAPAAAPVIVQPKPKVEDPTLKDKKRAAAPTKPATPTATPADFNPLSMSDDEFAKMAALRFR